MRFDINEEDNLNNRFKQIEDLRTDAIFSVDDDVIVPCHTLDFAFSVHSQWLDLFLVCIGWLKRRVNILAKSFLLVFVNTLSIEELLSSCLTVSPLKFFS